MFYTRIDLPFGSIDEFVPSCRVGRWYRRPGRGNLMRVDRSMSDEEVPIENALIWSELRILEAMKREVCDIALVQLSILLCHRQSYVRRTTSNKLYEALLVYGEDSKINPDNLDTIMAILSSTDWEKPIEEIRPIRNELCNLMGIRVPVQAKKKIISLF
ncbi:unnamed protein product [Diabrotica balteata]|uniref:Uncharacterized protein n=1 Tax=Diabrotica balteata TaxID=107213 RepID=A0A9N9T132_DIABA|nr:unnamed protein product [Diabrotica balteata]